MLGTQRAESFLEDLDPSLGPTGPGNPGGPGSPLGPVSAAGPDVAEFGVAEFGVAAFVVLWSVNPVTELSLPRVP
jgi:hypothetical protein